LRLPFLGLLTQNGLRLRIQLSCIGSSSLLKEALKPDEKLNELQQSLARIALRLWEISVKLF
jgi:hypothetical protein